jgi:hypothetical protein
MLAANPGDVRSDDAKFVNGSSRDYHLQSDSPCVDKGSTISSVTDDKDGISRPRGTGYDIGAYEYTSSDPTSTPIPTTAIPTMNPSPTPTVLLGDLNGDRKVDIADYNIMVRDFGKTGTPGFIVADINKNGRVEIFDYNYVIINFGTTN